MLLVDGATGFGRVVEQDESHVGEFPGLAELFWESVHGGLTDDGRVSTDPQLDGDAASFWHDGDAGDTGKVRGLFGEQSENHFVQRAVQFHELGLEVEVDRVFSSGGMFRVVVDGLNSLAKEEEGAAAALGGV